MRNFGREANEAFLSVLSLNTSGACAAVQTTHETREMIA